MKNIYINITLFLAFICSLHVSGQDSTRKVDFFNEFVVGLNKTTRPSNDFDQSLGFGVGAYRVINNQEIVNLVFGFEYNLNRQFYDEFSEGRYAHGWNMQYTVQSATIPLYIRCSIGKNLKAFVEFGFYADIVFNSKRKGTIHTWPPNGGPTKELAVNESAQLSNFNYGLYGGVGMRIPMKNKGLIIKSDYRYGLQDLSQSYGSFYMRYIRFSVGLNI